MNNKLIFSMLILVSLMCFTNPVLANDDKIDMDDKNDLIAVLVGLIVGVIAFFYLITSNILDGIASNPPLAILTIILLLFIIIKLISIF